MSFRELEPRTSFMKQSKTLFKVAIGKPRVMITLT